MQTSKRRARRYARPVELLLALLLVQAGSACGDLPPELSEETRGEQASWDEGEPYDVPAFTEGEPEASTISAGLEADAVVCDFAPGRKRGKTVHPAAGKKAKVKFAVDGLPDLSGVERAELHYTAWDADRPKADGWIIVNGSRRMQMPARRRLTERKRSFVVDVTGRLAPGRNVITFKARKRDAARFKISKLHLRLSGTGLHCTAPPPEIEPEPPAPKHPDRFVANRTPAGVAAFAALHPRFPTTGLMRILGKLARPYTSVLLDFGPAYAPHRRQMFKAGASGGRQPNPAHFDALDSFVRRYVEGTPHATSRKLQLYIVNGPGMRRGGGYSRAFPQGLGAFDAAVQSNRGVRGELKRYVSALNERLGPWRGQVDFRLVVSLEDNLSAAGARAMLRLAREAGWSDPVGRNPCACGGHGDLARVGDFYEAHVHGAGAVSRLPGGLRRGDTFSNDGWGWTVPHAGHVVTGRDVAAMARKSRETGVWLNLWYDPLQGYPIPSHGERDYRFDHRPAQLLEQLRRGL